MLIICPPAVVQNAVDEFLAPLFKMMTELTIELIRLCHVNGVLGNCTFDSFYTCYEIQNDINALQNADGTPRGYVGNLKFNRKMTFKGVEQKVSEFAATIPPEGAKNADFEFDSSEESFKPSGI